MGGANEKHAQQQRYTMARDGVYGNGNGGGYKRRAELDVLEIGSMGSFGLGDQTKTANEMYSDKLDLFTPAAVEEHLEFFR